MSTADETSTKLPVTDLYGAPLWCADTNLHWYKMRPCYLRTVFGNPEIIYYRELFSMYLCKMVIIYYNIL